MTSDIQFWNKIAPKYAAQPVRDEQAYQYTLERTRSYLKPQDRVLELGCGTGTTAITLSDAVAQIVATDSADGMLEVGRQRAKAAGVENVGFQCRGVHELPEDPVDVVMSFNLLHLVPDMNGTLSEVAKRLQPGGLFISKTPCLGEMRGSWKYWLFTLLIPLMRLVGKAPSVVTFLDIATLEKAIQRAGFEIIETGNYPVSTPGRYVVARRI